LKDNFNYQGNLASDLIRIEKEVELERFENNLMGNQASGNRITINDIDRIDGYEFERLLKELFKKMGYQVIHTPLSNDQGADLIVEKFGVKTVVQAKNWQDDVTNKGVQEVSAAIKHYDAQKAMVISSSGFTQSARELARSNDITLWDRSILAVMLDENPIFRV
jgi:restriction system protein